MKALFDEVLERIRPSENETAKINKIYNDLKNEITKQNLNPLIVGSIAKGTNLKGADIDLFIRFDEDADLKNEGLKVARKILPDGKELYAQHPYLRGEIEGIGIDLVPCHTIKDSSKPISAVDRTPFHTKWVNENIDGREDEVRLAKQFLKGAGAYGANAAIGGFSGYLVEILIIKYKNFKDLIQEISLWKPPVIIENVENAPKAAMMIRDPVDEKRKNKKLQQKISTDRVNYEPVQVKECVSESVQWFRYFSPQGKVRETEASLHLLKSNVFGNTGRKPFSFLDKKGMHEILCNVLSK